MKIEVTEISPVKKTLSIEASEDEVSRETEAVVRRWASQVRIPGFRQGKVPVDLVRKRFAKEIQDDVRERLVSRLYAEAAREKGFRPLGDPVLDELKAEEGQPFTFKTTFEVLPEFAVKDYKGVEVRESAPQVGEAEIDEALDQLRNAHARYLAEEGRAAAAGDLLVADVTEAVDGEEPRTRERAMLEVGLTDQVPAFNDAIHGAKPGDDLDFHVVYPADFAIERLAGRNARYQIHVHEVKRRELPALDDEFAKDMGDFESFAALRERIRRDLEDRKLAEVRSATRQAVLDKVLLENPVALPEILVEDEIRERLEDMVRAMMYHGVDPRTAEIDWKAARDRQEEPARKTVHARLVLDAVAKAESITVDRAEVEARISREAERIGEKPAAVRERLSKGAGMQALEIQMVREKSLDFLTSVANIRRAE
ncbi:MAG TPA: trigger factor [Candidatus Polarisedimenticolaceae bacterium]